MAIYGWTLVIDQYKPQAGDSNYCAFIEKPARFAYDTKKIDNEAVSHLLVVITLKGQGL